MSIYPYTLSDDPARNIGLIVLQSDERIEQDFRRLLPLSTNLYISRVPSFPEVTSQTLETMAEHIPAAAGLLPASIRFDALGYGCTSGTAQIGQQRIAQLLQKGAQSDSVSNPLDALVAACGALGVQRVGILSPYIEEVSQGLRETLYNHGIVTPVIGSFAEAEEARVARISQESLSDAAVQLAREGGIEALFLSCTNLNTLDIIAPLEDATGLPVLSSNLVLAWHLSRLARTGMTDMVGRCRLAKTGTDGLG